MKIAVLMGSPRKKDSYKICKEIESQLFTQNSDLEFDYIFLNEHFIDDCMGCCLCFQQSELKCPCKNDELNNIKTRLLSADGIIISSPVYAYQVTAQLKRFIDRMSYQFHRPEMVGKPALIVVTTDGGGSKQVYKYLKMTLAGWGMDVVGNIQITSPFYFENRTPKNTFGYDDYYHNQRHKQLTTITSKFSIILNSTSPKIPTFYDLFMFNCLRSKTYTSKVDRIFWEEKGWIDKSYFYDTKLNPIKKLFGSAMKQFIHMAGNKYLNKD